MLPQAEVLVVLLALGLYLYDSALLLHINEGVIIPKGSCGWRVRFGSSHVCMRGKELRVPSPFLPHRPEFRLVWGVRSKSMEGERVWEARRHLFRPLAPLVWAMACALFALLPLGLFSLLGDWVLLTAIGVLYLSIATALLWLGMKRNELGMSAKRLAGLAFELLACPPLAVNVIRRVSADMPLESDLMAVARRLQDPADWEATRKEFIARLDELIDAEDDNSARMALLQASRQKLVEEGPCPA